MPGYQLYNNIRKFCRDIGKSLRVLEDRTPWENKDEL